MKGTPHSVLDATEPRRGDETPFASLQDPLRILVGPWWSDQCALPARGLRGLGHHAVSVSCGARGPADIHSITDIVLDRRRHPRRRLAKATFIGWAAAHFDVYHFFQGRSLLRRPVDVRLFRVLNSRIIAHFCGSEVRNVELLLQRNAGVAVTAPMQTPGQIARVARWRRYADRMLVATPDLLDIIPDSTWLPQMIDLQEWDALGSTTRVRDPRSAFRLVHVPTSPEKKGTRYIEEAVDRLRSKGLRIELVVLTNGAKRRQIAQSLRTADAGIDQLLVGWYGIAATEMMANRLPVLCFVREDLRDAHAPDLPLISCSPTDVERRIEELVETSESERAALGDRGRAYVERRHDIRVVSRRLVDIYMDGSSTR